MFERLLQYMINVPYQCKVSIKFDQGHTLSWECTVDQFRKLLTIVKNAEAYVAAVNDGSADKKPLSDLYQSVFLYHSSYEEPHMCAGRKKAGEWLERYAGGYYLSLSNKEGNSVSVDISFCPWCGERIDEKTG